MKIIVQSWNTFLVRVLCSYTLFHEWKTRKTYISFPVSCYLFVGYIYHIHAGLLMPAAISFWIRIFLHITLAFTIQNKTWSDIKLTPILPLSTFPAQKTLNEYTKKLLRLSSGEIQCLKRMSDKKQLTICLFCWMRAKIK